MKKVDGMITLKKYYHRHLKVIGVMRKLKYKFSYHSLNQIYISYVRPILEYSSIVWEKAKSLEKLQNEAARIVTGLTRSITLEKVIQEM